MLRCQGPSHSIHVSRYIYLVDIREFSKPLLNMSHVRLGFMSKMSIFLESRYRVEQGAKMLPTI